ncbi:CST complex subunit Ten1 [Annulohypoxylon truncatum]|uniref:CST complex subunit Ten1 n=1 Tax=Annulohypoxylon truncatum TaxID=327061 RepID=UPI00200857C9|nr:CST complex subunit Ten1 [Annulohypoxylon truncatum]KAI1211576.1 CST complex subunit Ten1 [Annulohypoxylon truncatum]
MSSGPSPSVRCLMSDLFRHLGKKVRFLGCVTFYNTQTGWVTLEHNYHGRIYTAYVDAKLILESLQHDHVDVGQWVHVVGYVNSAELMSPHAPSEGRSRFTVRVQALVLWTAEDLDISAYEKTFERTVAFNRVADLEDPSTSSSTQPVE